MSAAMLAPAGWVSRSHRAIAAFELVRPDTVAAAVEAWSPGSAFLAGGVDLVEALKLDGAPRRVICLDRVAALKTIEAAPDGIRIGACVTHDRLARDPSLRARLPAAASAWSRLGNIRVRLAGTVGGNLLAGNPAYDGPVILGALGARLRFCTADGAWVVEAAADAASRRLFGNAIIRSQAGSTRRRPPPWLTRLYQLSQPTLKGSSGIWRVTAGGAMACLPSIVLARCRRRRPSKPLPIPLSPSLPTQPLTKGCVVRAIGL